MISAPLVPGVFVILTESSLSSAIGTERRTLDAAADCEVLRNDAALDRAPSPIRRSEARNSPLILPKTCAGPLHSMSPTIDMPEPMQERVPAFVGSSVAGGCSTTECCCCAVLPTTSAAFATAFFSLSGALLLNMSTSVFRRHPLRKGPRLSWAIEHDLTQSFTPRT